MSGIWLTPAVPGSISPAYLEQVRELHAVVRDWITASATAQKNSDIRANLPYVDLMFAFGFATLGDHPTANKLVEDARKVLEGPIPVGGSAIAAQEVAAAIVRNFLFRAFRYRVEQARNGQPLSGPLSAEVLYDRELIEKKGGSGPVNNPYKLAGYVIDHFREVGRILEPTEQVDRYADWTKRGDKMKWELSQLNTIREPDVLADRIRKLYDEGVEGKPLAEVRFYLLFDGLPLAARVSEAFVAELLEHVPASLAAGTGAVHESPDLPKRQGELLERALFLAAHFNRADIVKKLVDNFVTLVQSKPEETRFRLINVVTRQCLWSLKNLGLTGEIDRLLSRLQDEALCGCSLAELRKKHAPKSEAWASALSTLLNIASGWLFLGLRDRALPILSDARFELLAANAMSLQPKDYTGLARAYATAVGQAPPEECVVQMLELFRKMNPAKITNTWTTAQHYSRFHLLLVEDTVLAVARQRPEEPVAITVTA